MGSPGCGAHPRGVVGGCGAHPHGCVDIGGSCCVVGPTHMGVVGLVVGPTHVGWWLVVGPTHVGWRGVVRGCVCVCVAFECGARTPGPGVWVVSGGDCYTELARRRRWFRCGSCTSGTRHGGRGDVDRVYRRRVHAAHGRVEPRGVTSAAVPAVRRCRGDHRTGCRFVPYRLPGAARRDWECTVFSELDCVLR